MTLLERLAALRPDDLERDVSEFFGDLAWDKDNLVADGETLPLPVALAAIRKATAAPSEAPGRVQIRDL